MADYSDAYRYQDGPQPGVPAREVIRPKRLDDTSIAMQTSILKVKERKVTTIDFGFAPFKVEQFQELARLLANFPPGAVVEIEYGEYNDEESLEIKVSG